MKQCFVCILSGRLANSSPSYAEVEGAKLKFVCTQKNLFASLKVMDSIFWKRAPCNKWLYLLVTGMDPIQLIQTLFLEWSLLLRDFKVEIIFLAAIFRIQRCTLTPELNT